ncbi:non-muscle caldesmon [Syngnathus scovelli]|uniref:non-muscle caldesmon n=1 Tax=Syngnathus scovelli TaxID=161590 RepID=UPI0035CACFE1
MSKALLRRNSSKQSLQNLIRLTAQRSVEDAEEVERERRRRAREQSCHRNGDAEYAADNLHVFDGAPKPGGSPSVEEDEGFSDWTQRRQQKRHQRQVGRDEEERDGAACRSEPKDSTSSSSSAGVRCEAEDDDGESRLETDASQVSSTSKAFLLEDSKAVGAQQEVTSLSSNQSKSRNGQADAVLEAERRLEKIRLGLQEKESRELEELKRRHARAEQELEELARRKEQRSRLRSQEEQRRQDEQRQRLAKEEEERGRMKEEMARRRTDAAQRMKLLSGGDAEQVFSPVKTPTHKITERTESLSRSLKKSNSFKKTPAPVLVNNIDDKKEQYAHAVENSQEARGSKAPLVDLPNSLEAVTSKKNLFEGRSSSTPKTTSCQDTDGFKVAVTHLVSQWVKGQADGGRTLQSRAADVKSGDVMQKKNMWEVIGDSSGRSTANIKGSAAASKKYTFVVTGHGKYEKISVDRDHATNGKSDLCDS